MPTMDGKRRYLTWILIRLRMLSKIRIKNISLETRLSRDILNRSAHKDTWRNTTKINDATLL
jgi:hypothetical protein